MKLYKFFWDCGRMGDLDGLFACEPSEIEALIGKNIYFGEVLGKHSDIYGELEREEIEELNIDEKTVDILVSAIGSRTISGFNPLDFYEDGEDE